MKDGSYVLLKSTSIKVGVLVLFKSSSIKVGTNVVVGTSDGSNEGTNEGGIVGTSGTFVRDGDILTDGCIVFVGTEVGLKDGIVPRLSLLSSYIIDGRVEGNSLGGVVVCL